MKMQVEIDKKQIEAFCRKWHIREFSVFGSILQESFRAESDVDVLIDFAGDAKISLDDWLDMIDELKKLFGRDIDLVDKQGLRNPFRRHAILTGREVLYAA
jgi:hypothetical protein